MTDDTNIISGLIARSAAALKSGVERIRSSVLCRFAMIGAIVLTHRQRPGVRKQVISKQLARTRAESVELKKVQPGRGI